MSASSICPRVVLAAHLIISTMICAGLASSPAVASGPQITAPPAQTLNNAPSSTARFATIPKESEDIGLAVETAKVTIRRAPGIEDIAVSSSCPSHWNVTGKVIRQVALSTLSQGVSVRADATGAQAIVNGKIYQLPSDSDGTVHSLKIENGQVIINGQRLEPLRGSDVPGTCTGLDVLEVLVPENYAGGLILSCHGSADVNVDGWTGSNILLSLHGSSNVTAGKLNGLTKVVVDVDGLSKANIKGVSTKAFVANVNGSGGVTVGGGSAELSNATISGSGTITLKGKFRNLKKSVNGSGSIQVIE